jgi:hypothetical protein
VNSEKARTKSTSLPLLLTSYYSLFTDIWLGREDSNPYKQIQSLPSCHWTTPQYSIISTTYETIQYTINRQKRSIKATAEIFGEDRGFFELPLARTLIYDR